MQSCCFALAAYDQNNNPVFIYPLPNLLAARYYLHKKASLLLAAFIDDFSELYPAPSVQLTPADVIRADEVKAYLKRHLNQPLSLEHLYESLRINDPELLLEQFRKLHDITVQEFDEHFRMEKIFDRVVNTSFTFHFIAVSYGYKNVHAFFKAFRAYYGCHPIFLREGKGRQY